jgi:preprotein translocase subunit SecD
LPGIIAGVALLVYVAFMLALFQVIPVTLTAAGIAAFIISIGMAVDANVLIFERTKEEIAAGKSTREAIHDGFARAWMSIRNILGAGVCTGVWYRCVGVNAYRNYGQSCALALGGD